jgi:hypothetical protein
LRYPTHRPRPAPRSGETPRKGSIGRRALAYLGLVATLAMLASVAPGAVTAKPPVGDITFTPKGIALAKAAANRFAAKGRTYDYTDFKVLDYGTDGVMVVPVGTKVLGLGAVETSNTGAGGVVSLAAVDDDWTRMNDDCMARHYETGGYMDACWALYKEMSDGNSSYDWWGLHFFASMFTPEPRYWTGNGWVQAYRSGGPAQTWAYWDPRSDISGACHTVELNLLGGVFGFNHQACELWTFTKGNPTVTMRTTYHGNADGVREVAQTMTVRVAQGASPVFGLNWDMATCRYPNPCP